MKKGYFLVFLTAVISGFSIFINKFGVGFSNPYIFTWLKNLIAALLLSCLFLLLKDWKTLKKLKKKQWFLLITIGLVGGSIPFLLFFKGLSLTTASRGAFLHKTMFLYIAFLAFIFLKERINKNFLLAGLLLIIGNLLLLKPFPFSFNKGDLLIFLATLFWAVENIISKYALRTISGRSVAWGRMFFGSLFIFLFLLQSNQLSPLLNLDYHQIIWVIITSIFLLGYVTTWYCGLKDIPVSEAAIILTLASPITTLLAFIQSGNITLTAIFAGFLIVSGVILVLGFKKLLSLIKDIKEYVKP